MTNRSRQERLVLRLQEIARDLSGYTLEDLKPDLAFLELGFDSLFLTQLSTAYKKEFGIQITFRQLFDQYPSMIALSVLIDSELPADQFAETPVIEVKTSPVPRTDEIPGVQSKATISRPNVDRLRHARVRPLPNPARNSLQPMDGLEAVLLQQLDVMVEQLRLLEAGAFEGSAEHAPKDIKEFGPNVPALIEPADPDVPAAEEGSTTESVAVNGGSGVAASLAPKVEKTSQLTGFGPRTTTANTQQSIPGPQQQHLDSLIERYTRKTRGSKERTQRYRRSLADPRTAAGFNRRWKEMVYPIWVEHSLGSKLWDVDGNEYIDLLNGFGPNFFGHSPQFVTEALDRQLRRGLEVGPQTPLVGEVAEMICQLTGMDRVSFTCSGSEAVQAAMRLSRTVTGRDKVVVFTTDYHGNFDQVLVREANRAGRLRTVPSAPGIPFQSVDDTIVLEYGTEESLDIIRSHAEEIAAVLVEPIQSRRPEFQPREFLLELRRITRDQGIILVFDEVVTGFRIAPGGAQSFYGIEADLATYGKVVAGGMPIGVVAGREAVMNTFDGGHWQYGDDSFPGAGVTFFAGTFVRHPLVIAAAHASLTHLIAEGPALQERVSGVAAKFASELNRMFKSYKTNIEIAQFSSIMHLRNHEQSELAGLLHYHLRYNGVHIQEGFPCYMTDAHTEADVARVLRAFEDGVRSMSEAGIIGEGGGRSSDLRLPTNLAYENKPVVASFPVTACEASMVAPARFPSTVLQREMWLAAQINPDASAANNGSNIVELAGALDTNLLKEAIRQLVQRHDALRCTFSDDGNDIVTQASFEPEIQWHDLSGLDEALRRTELDRILDQDGRHVFDLKSGPLVSFRLIKLAEDLHQLVFTAQMIVCDGWGFKVVIEELSRIYSALAGKREPELEVVRQMREYVAWRSGEEARALEQKGAEFWCSTFDPAPPMFDLKTSRVRPPNRTYAARRESLRLPGDYYQEIKRASRELRNTPFATLLTSFAIWLHRLSGANDLVISVPYAAQGPLELATYVGQAVHALPIRVRLDPAESFREAVARTRDLILDAQDHWNSDLGEIVRKTQLPCDPSRLPLTSIVFNMDPAMTDVDFAGCRSRVTSGPRLFFTYDIGFNIVDEGESLLIECDYSSNLYDSESVAYWLRGFRALLGAAITNPSRLLNALPILESIEQPELAERLDSVVHEKGPDLNVVALVRSMAEDRPQAVALECGSLRLTYSELDQRSSRLAGHLLRHELRPHSVIAICLNGGIDFCVAALAVLRAGFAFAAADPNWEDAQLQSFLRAAEAKLIISESIASSSRLSCTGLPSLDIHEESGAASGGATEDRGDRTRSGDAACIVAVSGSGDSAGIVTLSHETLIRKLRSITSVAGISTEDVIAVEGPRSSLLGALETLLPLVVGARVVFGEWGQARHSHDLLNLAGRHGITVILAESVTWRYLLKAGYPEAHKLKLICMGEEPPQCLPRKLRDLFGEVWYFYGKADTTVASLYLPPPCGTSRGSLFPLAGVSAHVVDAYGQIVPPGIEGSLIIHDGQPSSSFQQSSEGRAVSTGDRARSWPDGGIDVIGASDRQVTLNHNVFNTADVEAVLFDSPFVDDATVTLIEAGSYGRRLVAYAAYEKAGQSDERGLRLQLRESIASRLPTYSRPSAIVLLDEIPRTCGGKIDPSRLPLPTVGDEGAGFTNSGAPKSITEGKIARFWSEVLNIASPSVKANFFEIGGQSFQAVSLFAKLENEFKVKLPLALLLKHPTIEELARVVDGGDGETLWSTLVPIQPSGSRPPLFLVHGAGGNVLLFHALADRLSPDYPVYGLQSKGLDGKSQPLHTIEEMAREYLREVRSIQPNGPYHLGGYCLGGTIAYEMAQLLVQQGERVALLAMLDTYNYSRALRVSFQSFILQKIRFHLANMSELGPREMFTYFKEKARLALGGELANLKTSAPGRALEEAVGRATSGVELSIQAINDHAAEEYLPTPYPGDVTMFKPRLNYKFYPDPNMGYGDLIRGRLDLVEVSTNPHAMLLDPHVNLLAGELERRIDASSAAYSRFAVQPLGDSSGILNGSGFNGPALNPDEGSRKQHGMPDDGAHARLAPTAGVK